MLLERAQPGSRLSRVQHSHARALHGVRVAAGQGRDARQPPEEVQRDALAGEDRALRARDARDDDRRVTDEIAVARERLETGVRVERTERRLGGAEAAHDSWLLQQELGGADRVLGDGRLRRDVPPADVLGERREHGTFERVGGYSHGSSTGSSPARRTTWRSNASLSVG